MTDNKRKAERLVRMLTDGYSGMKAVREVISLLEQWPAATPQPQREPLSDEQIAQAWAGGDHNASASVKRRITREIEAMHGIGVAK